MTAPSALLKEVPWSYSKIKNSELCPLKHFECEIAKNFSDDNEANKWGDQVHKGLAHACAGRADLPTTMKDYQPWVYRVRAGAGDTLVEQKYALTRDLKPTEYFGKDVWFRGIADIVKISGVAALALDWKTGKLDNVDSIQLMLMATCIFAHHSQLQKIRTKFIWLKEGDGIATTEDYTREDIRAAWVPLLERVQRYQHMVRAEHFPPKPGRLCARWCPVKSCQYNGKRQS